MMRVTHYPKKNAYGLMIYKIAAFLFSLLLLSFCGCSLFGSDEPKANRRVRTGAPGAGGQPEALTVRGEDVKGGVSDTGRAKRAAYFTVWAGSFLDQSPADRSAESLRKYGLTAFSVKKTLVENKFPFDKPVGDFHLVLAGLFGAREDASVLGSRLEAQGLIANWRVIPSDNPGELEVVRTQNAPLVTHSEAVTESVRERTGRPLASNSPAVSGQGFKNQVRGRYVGSYKDENSARDAAKKLTAAGWPASVEEAKEGGGVWYRVYMVQDQNPGNPRDMSVNPTNLALAKESASRQKGVVIVLDSSGLKGVWGAVKPNAARTDASSCAGYSQAGRLLTSMERLVGYIPDAGQLMIVKVLSYSEPSGVFNKYSQSVRSWWSGDRSAYAQSDLVYGPSVYNRPEVLRTIRNLKVDVRAAPMGPGLSGFAELESIPGKKIVVLFSDFRASDKPEAAEAALGQLKSRYGEDLDFIVVYGDADGAGFSLANRLSKAGGGSEAWNGCQLISDNAYFEKFVKRVFRR
jgi:cell division septation protein DedD